MSYFKSKEGSLESSINEVYKHLKDNAYSQFFKKQLNITDIDLISATVGPGLIGGLLVGLTFAKTL